MKNIFVILLLTACGTKEAAEALKATEAPERKEQVPTEQNISFAVSAKADLPECNLNIENQLAYVKETAEFYTCDAEAWSKISIRGKDGQDGKDGVSQVGETGPQGAVGATGATGSAGSNGAAGDSFLPTLVIASSGVSLGRVAGIDSTSRYLVVRDDGMRLQVVRTDGTISAGYFYYSGNGCTGTRYSVRTNGDWSNTNLETWSGKIYRQGATYANGVSYLSRSSGSTCTTTSGTVARAYTVTEVTLTGYPFGETELQ